MISFADADISAWLAAFIWPLTRLLGLFATAPVFSSEGFPVQVKIGLALAICFVVAPALPAVPAVDPASGAGLLILANQLLIGLAMGFSMRIVFVAVDMAGELAGLQMGLGFASFYDPQNAGDNPVISAFLGLIAMLVFLAMNGHLMLIATLVRSFDAVPIAAGPLAAAGLQTLAAWGAKIFISGLFLALPVLAALLIINLALGILVRAAPQLNLFAIGFPITLAIGMGVLALALPYFTPAFERLFEDGYASMLRVAGDLRPR